MSNWWKGNEAKMKSLPGDQSPSEQVSQQLALNTQEGVSITIEHHFHNLGFWLDPKMKYDTHIDTVPLK